MGVEDLHIEENLDDQSIDNISNPGRWVHDNGNIGQGGNIANEQVATPHRRYRYANKYRSRTNGVTRRRKTWKGVRRSNEQRAGDR